MTPVVDPARARPVPEELLTAVVGQLWESMLGRPAVRWPGELPAATSWLCAAVHLKGTWNGRVRLACDASTAAGLAAGMLVAGDEELSAEDVRDALGEVNIVGGGVKASLPDGIALGLPQVTADTVEGAGTPPCPAAGASSTGAAPPSSSMSSRRRTRLTAPHLPPETPEAQAPPHIERGARQS